MQVKMEVNDLLAEGKRKADAEADDDLAKRVKRESGGTGTEVVPPQATPLLLDHQIQFPFSFLLRLISPPFNEQRRSDSGGSSLRKLREKSVELVQRCTELSPPTKINPDNVLKPMRATREGMKKINDGQKSDGPGQAGKEGPLLMCPGLHILTILLKTPTPSSIVINNLDSLTPHLSPFFSSSN